MATTSRSARPDKPGTINAEWHQRNRMPAPATQQQRIRWHRAHAKACGCRPIPPTVLKAMNALTYVVFLRGMNVGGHRVFRPAKLAADLTHLDCVSIGAAGTFVIRKAVPLKRLRAELNKRLPFETAVFICHGENVRALVAVPPFEHTKPPAGVVRFVSVAAGRMVKVAPIQLPAKGKWLVRVLGQRGRFVFGEYRRDMKTIRFLLELDRHLGGMVTTRTWNTMLSVAKVVARAAE